MKEPKIPPSLLLKEKARIKDGLPHVIILSGQGYSLLWPQGQPIERHDWAREAVVRQLLSPALQLRCRALASFSSALGQPKIP